MASELNEKKSSKSPKPSSTTALDAKRKGLELQPLDRFLDRELSWLAFNKRVLFEASDQRNPILERANYSNIFRSNLDEFFMKRVGGLKNQVIAHVGKSKERKTNPSDVMHSIRKEVIAQIQAQSAIIENLINEQLPKNGIEIVQWSELTQNEQHFSENFFKKSIFPVLTPLAVDTGHPFPFMSNLSTSFGLLLKHPSRPNEEIFARVKVPRVFPSWFKVNPQALPDQPARYLSLCDLIGKHLDKLFPGMTIIDVLMFRVTRNADVKFDDDDGDEDADDLLELVSEGLRERRFARVVRLEHGPRQHQKIIDILKRELEVNDKDIYPMPLRLEHYDLGPIAECNRPDLRFYPWVPQMPPELSEPQANIFNLIRSGDLLVHHPYESFSASVERFIKSASEDPNVLAIKMTLYRTGKDSPFIPYLIRAAEAGKQVACLVELQARFDEERNILVAEALEDAGVHVVYGLQGLKTHCKTALVVRKETDGVRCYAHIGTGNYHAKTARLYTDFGLFTCNTEFTDDVVSLFHHLTGRSVDWRFKKLIVAPYEMKTTFLRMIRREIENAKESKPAHIIAKMNGLQDPDIIQALYQASNAGVKIDLIVRGVCCLRPGVKDMSENIRVLSVIGRFLEHSRIFYFRNGAAEGLDGEIYIGSSDWMARNLNERVEAVVPLEQANIKEKCWESLNILLLDQRQSWELQPDGTYDRLERSHPDQSAGTHETLMILTQNRTRNP